MKFGDKLKQVRQNRGLSQREFADILGTSKQVISRYELGQTTPKISVVAKWCQTLGINIDDMLNESRIIPLDGLDFPQPCITEDTVKFPVIGEAAAGYEHIALEDWSGETVEIPNQYLHGHPASDYIVLTVCGDSMYPLYLNGDKVLVLKQSTLDRSGQIGLILYEGENATLKKIEYVEGEDWLKLIPLNPEYPPRTIRGADLEQCSIIGIPRLLIRKVEA